jgi:porin
MKKIVFALALSFNFILILSFSLRAQDEKNKLDEALKFEVSYIGDNINNLSGGIRTGSCYLGEANIRLELDIEKLGLWKGFHLFINAANTHGASPSSELLGDLQVASNIEAGNHTYIQEVWFKQNFSRFELTIGLQDLNVEFANSEHGAFFLNSSFGILPIISNNIAAPIFPLTSLGFTMKWNISERCAWLNALYDGCPTNFDYNPYNLKWQFISGDGLLAISEFQHSKEINDLPVTYKLGIYSHSHIVERVLKGNIPDSLNSSLFGVYTYIDQTIRRRGDRSTGIFCQLGYSPSEKSANNFYFGFGMNYHSLFSRQGKDILGLALAYGRLKNEEQSETSLELSYRYQICRNVFIQPDFQYIINPAGTGKELKNSFAGNFRFGIHF